MSRRGPTWVRSNAALVGEQRGDGLRRGDRAGLVVGDDVHDAAAPAVGVDAAEGFHVDVLAGDRADDVRSGDEHAAAGRHDHDVGERRAVSGAAGRRAEHDRDLRHPAGRADHRLEHQSDGVQRLDAVGQPRAAGVPQPDDRHPLAHGDVDRVHDVQAAGGAHRAAHHGGVGAERGRRAAGDAAAGRHDAAVVARAQQLHRPGVEQLLEADDGVAGVDRGGRGIGKRVMTGLASLGAGIPPCWAFASLRERRSWSPTPFGTAGRRCGRRIRTSR